MVTSNQNWFTRTMVTSQSDVSVFGWSSHKADLTKFWDYDWLDSVISNPAGLP
jgi:hypothetical protein